MSISALQTGGSQVLSLRDALPRAVRRYRGGITSAAYELGMDYNVLQKKLQPDNFQRHLTPEELEAVIGLTRDPVLLDALVRPAGAIAFIPRPVTASRDALHALGEALVAKGQFVGALHDGVADDVWQRHEVEALRYHANQVIGQILSIVAGAEQAMLEHEEQEAGNV